MSHHSNFPARPSDSELQHKHCRNNKYNSPSLRHRTSKRQPHIHLRLLVLITLFLSFITNAIATGFPDINAREARELKSADLLGSTLARLARTGTIVTDPRARQRIINRDQEPQLSEIDLRKRLGSATTESDSKSTEASLSASTGKTTSEKTTVTSTAVASSTSSSGIVAATTAASSALPSPFDTSLGSNFTNSACPDYIRSFVADEDFKTCLPFSLLLQSSNSFFQAEKSVVRITETLDHSCSANVTFCKSFLSTIAYNLTLSSTCGADLTAQQPLVMQAYTGLIAYSPLYTASCLRNPSTSAYCFADAITNTSSPTDAYIYYLPLDVPLPGGSQPTCSQCLKNTMAVYEAASANRSQPIHDTYAAAAAQVNVQCGPNFVNASIAAVSTSGVPKSLSGSGWMVVWCVVIGLVFEMLM